METIKGYIDNFVYQNPTNGYVVMNVSLEKGSVTCVGIAQGYGEGESVEIQGEYVNSSYGRQIKIHSIKALPPEDKIAIIRYLGSGAIKGIGEALAKRIVNIFGDDTFRIATEEPERLAEVKGISLKKAYEIGSQISEKRDLRDAMMFLQGYGISLNLSNKIYQKYGMQLYQVLRDNPYRLAEDIEGVGFNTADEIALKSGVSVSSDYRIRCGIVHTMNQTTIDGNCYYPRQLLVEKAAEVLGVEETEVDQVLPDLVMEKKLLLKRCGEEERVYLVRYYYSEQEVAGTLCELLSTFDHPCTELSNNEIISRINKIEDELGIVLDELQQSAIVQCVKSGVFVLTGGPGTGKTTTINTLLKLLEEMDMEFMLAAPTGRAAKRMQETTGYEAKTLHRLLEISGDIEGDRGRMHFERNSENPLEVDAIIVDEMSMVDIHLFRALLQAMVPGTKLILVGDSYQLQSVGPGQVLGDIIASEMFPVVRLEKIYRQDEESHIITNAYKINGGEHIDFQKKYRDFFLLEKKDEREIYYYIEQLISKNVPKEFNINPLDVQVLSPKRKGGLGIVNLNHELQDRINPAAPGKREYAYGDFIYREGDKVMQVKNNYDMEWEIVGAYNLPIDKGNGIFNGDVGEIKSINTFTKSMMVVFDDDKTVEYPFENLEELELAYAITIHKSQGSEYPVIIIPLLEESSWSYTKKMLFTRNLLYTAITRARQCVILIGSSETVNFMIDNDTIQKRYTSLSERIKEASERM